MPDPKKLENEKEDVWKDCTDFLPENFEESINSIHSDSRDRLRRLGLIP